MEVVGGAPNRTKVKRRKADTLWASRSLAVKPSIRWSETVLATGSVSGSVFLPRESSRPPPRGGSHRERKDETVKGREQSDDRIVPEGHRKVVPTAACKRGGKAVTVSKQARQLDLFRETADSPQGTDGRAARGQPRPAKRAAPLSRNKGSNVLPAMTMEEVASHGNLIRALEAVASNRGAPGPDRQSASSVACK